MKNETELLEFGLKTARSDVKRNRSVLFQATILDNKGELAVVAGPGEFTEESKAAWFAGVKQIIQKRNGIAVMVTAPVSRAIYTPDGEKEVRKLRDEGIVLRIDDSVKRGFCSKVNSILASVQTPLQTVIYTQDYDYIRGKAVFGRCIKMDSNEGAAFTGLLVDFFDDIASTKPN